MTTMPMMDHPQREERSRTRPRRTRRRTILSSSQCSSSIIVVGGDDIMSRRRRRRRTVTARHTLKSSPLVLLLVLLTIACLCHTVQGLMASSFFRPQNSERILTRRFLNDLPTSPSRDDDEILNSSDDVPSIRRRLQQQQLGRTTTTGGGGNVVGVRTEFGTALAIVPALPDWDRLQRARHFARDPVFHQWPPALRLFHPFCPPSSSTNNKQDENAAFYVAQIIEDLDLEPFTITLDTWVIVPHLEAWQTEYENTMVDYEQFHDPTTYQDDVMVETEAEREIRELIELEERKANIKAQKRRKKLRRKKQQEQEEILLSNAGRDDDDDGGDEFDNMPLNKEEDARRQEQKRIEDNDDGSDNDDENRSPREVRDEQRRQLDQEFGGACILCLEPDEESKQKLLDLREALREGLGHDTYSSPSSVYSWQYVSEQVDMGIFRPLIPISKFDSFPAAMNVARRLKGLWGEPLTMDVKELHLVSCFENNNNDVTNNVNIAANNHAMAFSDSVVVGGMVGSFQQASLESKDEAWGCNAKIMLMGEEMKQDDEANREMVDMLVKEGQPGGMDITEDFTILEDEEVTMSEIEQYLNDDDDFDEGTQVVIGRVHFLTGEQRNYKGMPATSIVDGKDRALGENGVVSGSARRRGPTNRQSELWKAGEFGRRTRDFVPWGLRERTQKERGRQKEEEFTECL